MNGARIAVFELWPSEGQRIYDLPDSAAMARYERKLRFDSTPQLKGWDPPPVVPAYDVELPRANIMPVGMGPRFFVFDMRAKQVLSPILAASAEWLPIEIEQQPCWVFNPLLVVDCLDHRRTRTRPNLPSSIVEFAFVHTLLPPTSVFTIPEIEAATIFTHTGAVATTLHFKTAYEENKLTGLRFKEVWRSDG